MISDATAHSRFLEQIAQNSEVTILQEEIEIEGETDSDDTDDDFADLRHQRSNVDEEVLEEAEYDEEEDEEDEEEIVKPLSGSIKDILTVSQQQPEDDEILRVFPLAGETPEQAKERNLQRLRQMIEQGQKVPKIMVFQDEQGFDVEYEICAEEDEEAEEENESAAYDTQKVKMYQSQMINEQQSDERSAKGSQSNISNKFNTLHRFGNQKSATTGGPQRSMN